ncbi:preprotein translocase subunit SecG [Phocaeicola sp.]
MYLLFVGLIVLAALLMCFVVLIQNSKGGGLSSSFASSNKIMGVRKTTDFIEKLTWGLAIFMVVLSVATAYVVPTAHAESSVIMEEAVKEGATNPLNAPSGFAAPQTNDAATETAAPADSAQ